MKRQTSGRAGERRRQNGPRKSFPRRQTRATLSSRQQRLRQRSIGSSLGCIPPSLPPPARLARPGQYTTTLAYLSRPLLPSLTRLPSFLPPSSAWAAFCSICAVLLCDVTRESERASKRAAADRNVFVPGGRQDHRRTSE